MKLKMFAIGFMAVSLALTGAAWAAHDIVITPTSDGSTAKTDFVQGDTIILNIDWNKDAGDDDLAGCALTITYDATVLDAPPLDASGLPTTPTDVQTLFPFMTGSDKTYRVGNAQAGKLALSGAAIGDDGGAIERLDNDFPVPLFSIAFRVKQDAPIGNYQFGVQPTVLGNPDAGWENEASPVLVGAVPQGDPAFDDLSGGAFPVFPVSLDNNFADFSVTNDTLQPGSPCSGDITGDGGYGFDDVLRAFEIFLGAPASSEERAAANATCDPDGNVGFDDVNQIFSWFLQGVTPPQ